MKTSLFDFRPVRSQPFPLSRLDVTHCTLDEFLCVGFENTEVDLLVVQALVVEDGHSIAQHPDVSLGIDLEVVGEDHGDVVGGNERVSFWVELLRLRDGVPAPEAVPIHLQMVQNFV